MNRPAPRFCSALYTRLVIAPPEVLDYIVVHELAHLAEPYHSTRFWLIVRSYCPDNQRHRTWLKDHEAMLHLSGDKTLEIRPI